MVGRAREGASVLEREGDAIADALCDEGGLPGRRDTAVGSRPEDGRPAADRQVFDRPRGAVALKHRRSGGDTDRAAEADEVVAELL